MIKNNFFVLPWLNKFHEHLPGELLHVFLTGCAVALFAYIFISLIRKPKKKNKIKILNILSCTGLCLIAAGLILLWFTYNTPFIVGCIFITAGLNLFYLCSCLTLIGFAHDQDISKRLIVLYSVLVSAAILLPVAGLVSACLGAAVFLGAAFFLTGLFARGFFVKNKNYRKIPILFFLEIVFIELSLFATNVIVGLGFLCAGILIWGICYKFINLYLYKVPPMEEAPEVPLAEGASFIPDKKFAETTESYDGLNQSVTRILNPFVPAEFLNILNKKSVADLRLGDHAKQEMTIFFSDIRQFTDLSEKLTPEESFRFINSYLSRIVPIIQEHNGFVDKYMGDAILALYHRNGGADAAVQTSINIQKTIAEYNIHRLKMGYRPLSMGIGIHTGPLMIGVVGVEDRMQNTVISDAVNLTSRLESITKVFNISLAISEETFKKLEDPGSYMYRFIGKVRVKGKVDPVSVFEIFDGVNEKELEQKMKANIYFEQGMINYYQKNMVDAVSSFKKVLEILPKDGATVFYLENCMAKLNK